MPESGMHHPLGNTRLLFPCSGGADIGEISDRAARQLARSGFGRMLCLAGVGGRVPLVMDAITGTAEIWAIDGCAEDCARRTLELGGYPVSRHLRLTELGLEKGRSPASDHNIATVLGEIQKMAANPRSTDPGSAAS